MITESDPLGNTKTTSYDPAGRIAQITTPNGYPSTHTYDGRGRLTKWVDAENFPWLYAYDGNANITNITDALGGHYVMAYSNRNERILERNQDNFEWQYTYDQLLRLKTQRDPNLTLRTRTYDAASRVRFLTLSTGREDSYEPDDNDNPRVIVRRVNGVAQSTTSLTYDALDRVTRVVDPHSQSVDYGFDALSRVVSLTYPGNRTLTNRYDALSRLTNQVDWAARQMSYAYDKAGRLIRRAYPNGVVQTNTFDSAGRLTGLSHSSLNSQPSTINLALTYAYDRNGNKVGNTERGTLAWPLPTLTDETASFTASGRLQTRVAKPTPLNTIPSPGGEGQGEGGTNIASYAYSYDASGNLTNAVMASGGITAQSWRLTYDEDNRTTSLYWDWGMATQLITNRYDALGRRIARRVDGVETRYVLDLSGAMERILCDTTASGQITAWYVHGPDLCYRVDASNNVIYYHADAQANIIAVTDGGGTNVAQYAYTPYGRSLGSTNSQLLSANSYLFVGSQGVMEELPGLYFMRARYYSADAGVFLSTDPLKKIGSTWKSVLYEYAGSNPLSFVDSDGREFLAAAWAYYKFEQSFVKPIGDLLEVAEAKTDVYAGFATSEQAEMHMDQVLGDHSLERYGLRITLESAGVPGASAIAGIATPNKLRSTKEKLIDLFPGKQTWEVPYRLLNIGINFGVGTYNRLVGGGGGATSGMANKTPAAANNATVANASQSQPSASPGNQSASTSNSGGGSGTSGGGSTSSGGSSTYTVKAGDTLGNIGYANGTTATAIGAANGIQNLNLIRPGQVLTIPRR